LAAHSDKLPAAAEFRLRFARACAPSDCCWQFFYRPTPRLTLFPPPNHLARGARADFEIDGDAVHTHLLGDQFILIANICGEQDRCSLDPASAGLALPGESDQ
jgi:hypothetical protein